MTSAEQHRADYVGLTLAEAQALAASRGQWVQDCTGSTAVTADLVRTRVRIWLNAEGRVEQV